MPLSINDTGADPPSDFIVDWATKLAPELPAPRRALDVAMGRGRHADVLAGLGYRVFGVDINLAAVRDAIGRARRHGLRVRGWCADLTDHPLPANRFELIVVTRYLQRERFPAIRNAVRPAGVVLYETFTEAQRALGRGPTSPDHLLGIGELRAAFARFEVISYEESAGPDATARIVARKPYSE